MATTEIGTARTADKAETVDLLIYSDDVDTRRAVMAAVGRRPGKGLPLVRWTESATHAGVVKKVEEGDFALLVLDGETGKVGGMAVSRQLKNEIYNCPPVLILTARPQDAWLAVWADADAVVQAPLDPVALQEAVAALLRARQAR
ncbi:response regulator transcription factor [Georgenia subflava]|uniref:Response regulator n=1 Tax=Georgenia subflava TaxID=1622177 RepID=A0A6N7ETU7_9MICO|nr:response regulator transcription factor [Georgenia subflava]MPV38584.1 response regulator [Georgenia subflava]